MLDIADIFDGEEHWLQPGEHWNPPFLSLGEFVAVFGSEEDELEGPDVRCVLVEGVAPFYDITLGDPDSWGSFSIMLQTFAKVLGGRLIAEQQVARDKQNNVVANYYRVKYVGPRVEGI